MREASGSDVTQKIVKRGGRQGGFQPTSLTNLWGQTEKGEGDTKNGAPAVQEREKEDTIGISNRSSKRADVSRER